MNQPAPAIGGNASRIKELDGLRGIAILLVISFHYINNQLVNNSHPLAKMLGFATSFGWLGVDLFFVLSGFLICSVLLRTRTSQNYLGTFFIRRAVRIIPNYYLLVALFFVIINLPYFSGNYFLAGNRMIPDWSYPAMVHNFFMATRNNMGNDAMSVTWSIGIEEQFYLVFPFLLLLVRNKWLPVLFFAIITLALISRYFITNWIPAYVLLHCRADALAMGGLIAWLNSNVDLGSWYKKYFRIVIAVVAGALIAMVALFVLFSDLGPAKNLLFSIFFGWMLIVGLVRKQSLLASILRIKPLMWIGTISYSLYLFHYLILGLTHHFAGNETGIGIYTMRDVLISLVALTISFAFAWMVYRFLETPFVKLGKRFKY